VNGEGWLALALAMTTGCSERLGVRIHAEHDAEALLVDASEILGVWLEPGDGPIVLELVDVASGEPAGRVLVNRSCLRVIRASYSAAVVAHEVGHVLGLEHVDDPRNVMAVYTDDESLGLTQEQRSTIETAARELARCP
jgi:hypothetical protein